MKNDALKTMLRTNGFNATGGKAVILRALLDAVRPLNAAQLRAACPEGRTPDAATVYRTLKAFREKGLAREIPGEDGSLYYEGAVEREEHPHLRCRCCRTIYCLDALAEPAASQLFSLAGGHRVSALSLTFDGVCKSCAEKEAI